MYIRYKNFTFLFITADTGRQITDAWGCDQKIW